MCRQFLYVLVGELTILDRIEMGFRFGEGVMHTRKIELRAAIAVSALLLSCCGMVLARRSAGAGRDRRALLDLEDRWLASEDDPDVLQNILADDFIHALAIGFITKDEQLG